MSGSDARSGDPPASESSREAPRTLRDRGRAIVNRTFESLQEPDFRILWYGFIGSWVAMQMQQVARGYLAYELTGNALALGLVTMAMGLPRIVLSPIGGVLADRFTKRSVLLYTQAALGLIALFQALLLSFHLMTIEWLVVAGFLQGTAFSFNMPARQAYLPAVVGTGDKLANALALNNAGMNLTRVLGPAIAGVLIAVPFVNVPGIFYIIAVCYIWVWWSVYRVKNPGRAEANRRSIGQSLGEGFEYVFKHPQLLALMSLGFVPLAIGMPYISLMPVIALHDLQVGSVGLGLLLSAGGIGSLCGTLGVAYYARYPRKAFLQQILGVVFGITLIGFGFFAWHGMILPALPCLFVAGLSGDAYMALNSTLIMMSTDKSIYGRVMGVYMMAQSIRPMTVLPISAIADAIGTSLTVLGCGSVCAVFVFGVAALYPGYRDIGRAEPATALASTTP